MPNVVAPRRGRAAAYLLALVAIATMGLAVSANAAQAASPPALDPQERALAGLINQLRAMGGVPPLRASLPLTRAADWLSLDMAATDVLDHVDSRGRDFAERLRTFGYRGSTIAENIAGGDAGAAATFKHLKGSPMHRRNMLRARFRVIGIGRAHSADATLGWYWTTTFGA